ncbi:hypothetical protein, partial [Helicobacter pylori]
VNAKIDRLNQIASGLGVVGQAVGFPLKRHDKVDDLSKVGLSRNQKLAQKIDNLNQAVSEAKATGDFSRVEQALADLKNFSKEQLAQQAQKNEDFNTGKNSALYQFVK